MYKKTIIYCFQEKRSKMNLNILSFEIGGFRNITATKITLNDVTAIIGLNGYGKSNVISAIDFGIDFIGMPFKRRMMASTSDIPLLKSIAGMDYKFEIEAKYDDFVFKYGFSFGWETIHNSAEIKEEHLLIKSESGTKRFNTYISRELNDAKIKTSVKGRCDTSINVSNDELVINKLNNNDRLFYKDVISEINNLEFCIEKHLDTTPSFQPDPLSFNYSEDFRNINNIPRIIWEIKQKHEKKYNILIDTFMQIFPSIKELRCIEHPITVDNLIDIKGSSGIMFRENFYTLTVKDERLTQPLNFNSLSDGTRRVFLALTFAVMADIRKLSVIVFEEPENSVHPSLLQTYLRTLDSLSGNCKIIFTSHSPYMIQYMPLESVYIGLKCSSGQVDFRRITNPEGLIKLANKYDKNVGDLIFDYISFNNANEMLNDFVSPPASTFINSNTDDSDDENDNWLIDNSEATDKAGGCE